MGLSPCLYFGTRRSTYSDVVSVVTTVKRIPRLSSSSSGVTPLKPPSTDSTRSPSFASPREASTGNGAMALTSSTMHMTTGASGSSTVAWAERALRLSKDTMRVAASGAMDAPAHAVAVVGASPLAASHDRTRYRRETQQANAALHSETQLFMARLHDKRRVRFEREHCAALVVQRVYRGFVLRRRFRELKTKLELRKRIRETLVTVTRGTAIVTGEKDRRARVLAAQTAAAWRIQQQFRRWIARRVAAKARRVRQEELQIHSAVCIQRTWRMSAARASVRCARLRLVEQQQQTLAMLIVRLFQGYKARQYVRCLRMRQCRLAAQRVQWAVQRHLADRTRRLQHRRHRHAQQHDAATHMQRVVRGHLSRKYVLALRMREDVAVRVASALAIQRVVRGFVGRMHVRYERVFAVHARAWVCALHVTRIVRGFLARRAAALERALQETDVLVQTRRGNVSSVIDLLDGFGALDDAPADVAAVSARAQNTIVHFAAQGGHVGVLTHVVPLLLADTSDRRDTLRGLLYARNRHGETPLGLAIAHGHEHCAAYLLATTAALFDADVHALVPVGRTSTRSPLRREQSLLLLAARRGMSAIVAKLLLLFPRAFTGTERDAWTKRSVLHEALLLLRPERLETPREAAEREDRVVQTLTTILTKLPHAPIDAQDIAAFTPLHVAAQLGSLRAVRLLLEYGADVTIADASGRTAWRIALLQSHDACFLELRRKWLDSVTTSSASALEERDTSLESVADEDADSTSALPSSVTRTGVSRLQYLQLEQELVRACRVGDLARAQCLVREFDVSINAVDSMSDGDGDSALMLACRSRNAALVHFLVASQDVRCHRRRRGDSGGGTDADSRSSGRSSSGLGDQVLDVDFVNHRGTSAIDEARQAGPAILELVCRACGCKARAESSQRDHDGASERVLGVSDR